MHPNGVRTTTRRFVDVMILRPKYMKLEANRSVLRLAGALLVASSLLVAAMATAAPDLGRAAERSRAQVTKALIGSWTLKATPIRDQDGDVIGSLYKDPVGKLTYTRRGDTWAFVGERERTSTSDSSLWYTGTFSVRARAKEVVHHVEFSSAPSIEGTDQIRHYRLRTRAKDRLVLSVETAAGGSLNLRWIRRR